jgi:starch synthase
VRLVIPRYRGLDRTGHEFQEWVRLTVPTPAGKVETAIGRRPLPSAHGHSDQPPGSRSELFAIRHDPFFNRSGLYQEKGKDYPDNLERFALFSRAVLELLLAFSRREGWTPDVLHVHDWQTALCPVYLRTLYAARPELASIGTLFTVHNMGFQGLFPRVDYPKTGLGPEWYTPKYLEFHGRVNLMKGGLVFADYLSTVSPTYGREIQTPEFGFGLEGVVKERADRLVGIVNGIDTEFWNPATDPSLPYRYTVADLTGKRGDKIELQREMNLPVREVPLLVVISRLTLQKGLDLVAEVLPDLAARDVQVLILGTGEASFEARFSALQARFPDKVAVRLGFDEQLAHRIQAGGDMLLMPSRYEPCGLSQLYSLRYGTVPIVRRTGGLADTVVPYSPQAVREGRATGFLFGEATPQALLTTALQALRAYADRSEWERIMRAGMTTDVSWSRSARAYVDAYRKVVEVRKGAGDAAG